MPTGIPFTLPASLVLFISLSGFTKLRTTRFTDGNPDPSPRSMIQWFAVSKSVILRTAPQPHPSLLQCHVPYTAIGCVVAAMQIPLNSKQKSPRFIDRRHIAFLNMQNPPIGFTCLSVLGLADGNSKVGNDAAKN